MKEGVEDIIKNKEHMSKIKKSLPYKIKVHRMDYIAN